MEITATSRQNVNTLYKQNYSVVMLPVMNTNRIIFTPTILIMETDPEL